jgi:hypothetical protein
MDAFQSYFNYQMGFGCGIPSVTLLGTPADWRSIRQRAAMFGEFELEPWTRALLPVLERTVRTAEGQNAVRRGLFGVIEDAGGALAPELGWAVSTIRSDG